MRIQNCLGGCGPKPDWDFADSTQWSRIDKANLGQNMFPLHPSPDPRLQQEFFYRKS